MIGRYLEPNQLVVRDSVTGSRLLKFHHIEDFLLFSSTRLSSERNLIPVPFKCVYLEWFGEV